MVFITITLLLTTAFASGRHASIKSGLAVIRDKVTPEEMSVMILNPRKRDLTSLSAAQNQIEAAKIQTIIEEEKQKETKHEREVRAVQMITTRLDKRAEEEMDFSPDHFVKRSRFKRVVMTQGNRKPKPLPAAFLTAVARIVVPARPDEKTIITTAESAPRLLRLSDAK